MIAVSTSACLLVLVFCMIVLVFLSQRSHDMETFDTNMFTGSLPDDSSALKDAPLDITFIDQSAGRTSVFQVQTLGLGQLVLSPLQQFTKSFKEREAIARSSRLVTADNYIKNLPGLYSRFLLDFQEDEKDAIVSIIQKNQQLRTFSWHFMKMDDTMEFARPFIFGNTIVLSKSACQKFANPQSDQDKSDNQSLLMRHQIYLQQMTDTDKFESVYESLKPQDALISNTPADPIWSKASHLQVPKSVSDVMYTDPNTSGRYWLFRSGKDAYWPGLFIDKDFQLVQLAFKTTTNQQNMITVLDESVDLSDFSQLFNGSDVYYHPACQVAGNPMALKMDLLLKFSGN